MPPDRIQLSQEILVAAIGDSWPKDQIDAVVELLAGGDGCFPSGARKLPPDLVRAVQRQRLIVAMLKAASELGYRGTNVQDVIDRAGVSRPTFYEHFSNKEDCFLAAFDTSAQRLRDKLEAAALPGGEVWRDRLRFSLVALLEFAAAEPDTARAMIVEARAGSADAVMRRVELLDHFATCLDAQVRELLPAAPAFSMTTATGIIGGVESLLYARLCKGEHDDFGSLLPSLMYFVVLPYEGHEAAAEELSVEAP
ncbi:MAG: TetR/AcrR family transcriptional regulator [Solirubrobacterales bacterium]|nr:TetR/AcrR family transcriptional regulator [Solirubrobacterales bacterium]